MSSNQVAGYCERYLGFSATTVHPGYNALQRLIFEEGYVAPTGQDDDPLDRELLQLNEYFHLTGEKVEEKYYSFVDHKPEAVNWWLGQLRDLIRQVTALSPAAEKFPPTFLTPFPQSRFRDVTTTPAPGPTFRAPTPRPKLPLPFRTSPPQPELPYRFTPLRLDLSCLHRFASLRPGPSCPLLEKYHLYRCAPLRPTRRRRCLRTRFSLKTNPSLPRQYPVSYQALSKTRILCLLSPPRTGEIRYRKNENDPKRKIRARSSGCERRIQGLKVTKYSAPMTNMDEESRLGKWRDFTIRRGSR